MKDFLRDNPPRGRIEMPLDGQALIFAEIRRGPGRLILGRVNGEGREPDADARHRFLERMAQRARDEKVRLDVRDPEARSWFESRPEHADVLAEPMDVQDASGGASLSGDDFEDLGRGEPSL